MEIFVIIIIESRLYIYVRYGKAVKSINGLTRYIYICEIPIILLYYQSLNLEQVLEYNIINSLDLPLDNNKKHVRPANIDKQRLMISNLIS